MYDVLSGLFNISIFFSPPFRYPHGQQAGPDPHRAVLCAPGAGGADRHGGRNHPQVPFADGDAGARPNLVSAELTHQASLMEFQNYKIVYRRYASLFFIVGVDLNENELGILEFIHSLVETFNTYFKNVVRRGRGDRVAAWRCLQVIYSLLRKTYMALSSASLILCLTLTRCTSFWTRWCALLRLCAMELTH